MKLEWVVDDWSYKARGDKGEYELNDWGAGNAYLVFPSGRQLSGPWDLMKQRAQEFEDA